jgi:predicted DNA-binding WGR domain protein
VTDPRLARALEVAVEEGGLATDDVLDRLLPLFSEVAAAHDEGMVADLEGLRGVVVADDGSWHLGPAATRRPELAPAEVRRVEDRGAGAIEVVGRAKVDADLGSGMERGVRVDVLTEDTKVDFPIHVRGYRTWEGLVGHHDALVDAFVLGSLLASLACGVDLTDAGDHSSFVDAREHLFRLAPAVHPVVARAVLELTEADRRRRTGDLAGVIQRLETYRDQPDDFDLSRVEGLAGSAPTERRQLILQRLRDRLFDPSRRNRLLYFRPTQQTVDLTVASVPQLLDHKRIRPEQLLTWHPAAAAEIISGKPVALGHYLRFEEAPYLTGMLDKVISQARRDRAEYGFAQLRLVVAFLRWHDLRNAPEEVVDSPLLLLPVELSKKKGVRDTYVLQATTSEAEVNPSLQHVLKELYDLVLPDRVDLASTSIADLHALLADQIHASEPAVAVRLVDRPRIDLVQRQARLRADVFRRRQANARRTTSIAQVDHSYRRDDYRPLGIQLFNRKVRPAAMPQRTTVGGLDDTLRMPQVAPAATEVRSQQTYSLRRDAATGNPYEWEVDLCRLTIGNFNYRRMTLVQDYQRLLDTPGEAGGSFDQVFAVEGRPLDDPTPIPGTAEQYTVVDGDATQLRAVAKATSGSSYIIQGPPGTGKSQTITNLIADAVARGRRVLFVCEKRAAVDVVYHRLRQQGLDSLCCLIHDSQADKRAFIQDLRASYEATLQAGDDGLDAIEAERDVLVGRIDDDLADLARLSGVLVGDVPGTDRRALHLIDHLLRLRAAPGASVDSVDLEAEDEELLPDLADWWPAAPAARRLERVLADIADSPIVSHHAVTGLGRAVLSADRPNRTARALVQRARAAATTITTALDDAGVPPIVGADLDGLFALATACAEVLEPLARLDALDLLDPSGPRSRVFEQLASRHGACVGELATARAGAAGWQNPPDPATAAAALSAARRKEGKALAGLSGDWRAARRLVEERYHGPDGTTVSTAEALERLVSVHEAEAALDALRADVTEQFHTADMTMLVDLVERGRRLRRGPHRAVTSTVAHAGTDPRIRTIARALSELEPDLFELRSTLGELFDDPHVEGGMDGLLQLLDEVAGQFDLLPSVLDPLRALSEAPPASLRALRSLPLDADGIEWAAGHRALARWFGEDRAVARLDGGGIERRVSQIAGLRRRLLELNGRYIQAKVRAGFLDHVRTSGLPAAHLDPAGKTFKKAYAAGRRELEHEFGKVMRYRSIRELVGGPAGAVIADLKPVWLMSPLSVSDTLPLDPSLFDIVVFDEASQIPLEEAVPSLHRAQQVVVVGDQMQLPPTSFFAAAIDESDELSVEEDGETMAVALDGDSFLNQSAANLPSVMLAWHYRSRAEALIGFSNAAFYGGALRTIPERSLHRTSRPAIEIAAPADGDAGAGDLLDRPISFHHIEGGVYANRRNNAEAAYIAELVRGLLSRGSGKSIGVVAFSEAQQGAIEEALAALAAGDPEFAARLEAENEREEDDQFVGLFVKNLENVQGDERDVIILSVCYGPDATGRIRMNFGPINARGGEKRLNVIFSRAKHHMAVVTSMRSHAITNDWNEGAAALKAYLRYAEACSTGNRAHASAVLGTYAPQGRSRPGSRPVVLDQIAAALVDAGFEVETDLGTSAVRCDLAVRRPGDTEHRLAVLLDHRPAEAGVAGPADDHERYIDRPRALAAIGWETTHILAKDWLSDPAVVLDRICRRLDGPVEPAAASPAPSLAPPPAPPPAPAPARKPQPAPSGPADRNGNGNGYLIFWTADTINMVRAAGEIGQPLQVICGGHHLSKPPLGRYGIEAGDRIYVVSVRKGALHLIASMTVDDVIATEEYLSRLDHGSERQPGHGGFWDHGADVALGRDGTSIDLRRVVPPEDVATITFQPKRGATRPISHVDGRIEQSAGLTGNYLRLTSQTESLFRRVLAGPSKAAPAARPAPAPPRPVAALVPPAPRAVALPTAGAGRRFHYIAGTSSKFWQISRTGAVVFVTFGRIGTKGQTQVKDLENEAAAEAHVAKLIGEKTRKGYTEVSAS